MANLLTAYEMMRISVLVVDRNPNMRSIIRQILGVWNVRDVREASNAADAFQTMQLRMPDLVTTGFRMEPIDGIEFVRMVRTAEDSPCPTVPIIMVSAYSEDFRVRQARDAGIHEFLAKPITGQSLYARIVDIIENPRMFVRAKNYVGPDRHRHDDGEYEGPRRRIADGGADEEERIAAVV